MPSIEYDIVKVKRVHTDKNGDFSITGDDGWSLFLSKEYGVVPKAGMTMERYGGVGQTIRGICLDGVTAFFKGQVQLDQEHADWLKKTREGYKKDYETLMEEIKDEPSRLTVNISGMGGGYERMCQLMLLAGVEFLKGKPNFTWDYRSYTQVYGVCWSDSADAKALDEALMKACDNDCTGAMHQAVIGHLRLIHKEGHAAWLESFKAPRRFVYPKELPAPSI